MRGWKDEMSSKLMHEKGDFHIGAGKKDEKKNKKKKRLDPRDMRQ